MTTESGNTGKDIEYPAELTFKSVFRNGYQTQMVLTVMLSESGIKSRITSRESANGKFISYTVTAVFSSEEELQSVCEKIATIEGFMTMF